MERPDALIAHLETATEENRIEVYTDGVRTLLAYIRSLESLKPQQGLETAFRDGMRAERERADKALEAAGSAQARDLAQLDREVLKIFQDNGVTGPGRLESLTPSLRARIRKHSEALAQAVPPSPAPAAPVDPARDADWVEAALVRYNTSNLRLDDLIYKAIEYGARHGSEGAARDVLAERERQKAMEGWSEHHDDQHDAGDLAHAAGCYAIWAFNKDPRVPKEWPWDIQWWKPKDPRRNLVRAGALILAEIDRLDRLAQEPEGTPSETPEKGGQP